MQSQSKLNTRELTDKLRSVQITTRPILEASVRLVFSPKTVVSEYESKWQTWTDRLFQKPGLIIHYDSTGDKIKIYDTTLPRISARELEFAGVHAKEDSLVFYATQSLPKDSRVYTPKTRRCTITPMLLDNLSQYDHSPRRLEDSVWIQIVLPKTDRMSGALWNIATYKKGEWVDRLFAHTDVPSMLANLDSIDLHEIRFGPTAYQFLARRKIA